MSKKDSLSKLINKVIPNFLYPHLSRILGEDNQLKILTYHRVFDVKDYTQYKFDPELISTSTFEFDQQIGFIKRHYNPVSIVDVVNHYDMGTKLPKNAVLITFDDGFRDNYTNAFPILKKHDVPAVIFLSTEFIGGNTTLWFDKLAYIINNTKHDRINLSDEFVREITSDNKLSVIEDTLEYLKIIPNTERLSILKKLEENNTDLLSEMPLSDSSTMTWDQVREMDKSVIDFGSHSITHPILSQLSDEELDEEISESKIIIESVAFSNNVRYCISRSRRASSAFLRSVMSRMIATKTGRDSCVVSCRWTSTGYKDPSLRL